MFLEQEERKLNRKDISFEFFYGYDFYQNQPIKTNLIEMDENLKNVFFFKTNFIYR